MSGWCSQGLCETRSRTRQGGLPRLEAAARRWPAALSSPLLCSLCIKPPLAHPFPAIPAPAPLSPGFCFASPGPSGLLSRNQMGFFSHSLGTSAHAPLSRFDSLSLCSSSSGPMVVPQMPPPPRSLQDKVGGLTIHAQLLILLLIWLLLWASIQKRPRNPPVN